MQCVFCDWWKQETSELSTTQALKAIDEVCGLGVSLFDLSGGEPLLRRDISILARRAASYGCLVSLNTNGTLVTPSQSAELAEFLDVVVVSLDGPKAIHDRIRGVPGTFDRALTALSLLKDSGLRVGVNSVITPWNIAVLPGFLEDLRSMVDYVQIQPIHPFPPPRQNIPSSATLERLLTYLQQLRHQDPGFLAVPEDFIQGFEAFFQAKSPKICHAGGLYVAIDPQGNLLACPARADILLGNLLATPAHEILRRRSNSGWSQIRSCPGCWLECTVGISMLLEHPLKEVPHLLTLWSSK
jgi:MoaA/NifB/PqqE/SkfB family radical SAM enzyme